MKIYPIQYVKTCGRCHRVFTLKNCRQACRLVNVPFCDPCQAWFDEQIKKKEEQNDQGI